MSTNKKNMKIVDDATKIPDIQGLADTRNLPINKVGIKDILHPIIIKQRSGNEQSTIAKFNMYVNLPHDFKGTHTAPIPVIPIYANINSGLFCIQIATRSPFLIPSAINAFPT